MSTTSKDVQKLAAKVYAAFDIKTLYFAAGGKNAPVDGVILRALALNDCYVSTDDNGKVMCWEFDTLNAAQLSLVNDVLCEILDGVSTTDIDALYGVLTKDNTLVSRSGITKHHVDSTDLLVAAGLFFFMKGSATYLLTTDQENILFCSHCGRMLIPGIDDAIVDDGVKYCPECIKEHNYGECAICHKKHIRVAIKVTDEILDVFAAENVKVNVGDIVNICKKCNNEKFTQCSDCGAWIKRGNRLCKICTSGKINQYSYKPTPKFKKISRETTKLFFGLEIELEAKSSVNVKHLASIVNTRESDYFYCKNDGSLSHGFEIVSEPMTYNFLLQKSEEFHKFLQDILRAGGYSYKSPNTGVHIHLSRDAFKDSIHIFNFMKCYYTNKAFTEHIALRTSGHYCHFNNGTLSDLRAEAEGRSEYRDRYRAINTCNSGTIEVRVYKGNLKFQTVLMYIQHCLCCFEYAKTMKDSEAFNVEKFKQFITEKAAHDDGFAMIHARVMSLDSAAPGGKYAVEETLDDTEKPKK